MICVLRKLNLQNKDASSLQNPQQSDIVSVPCDVLSTNYGCGSIDSKAISHPPDLNAKGITDLNGKSLIGNKKDDDSNTMSN